MADETDQVDLFFALAGEGRSETSDATDVIGLLRSISGSPKLSAAFRKRLRGMNDKDRKSIVRDTVKRIAAGIAAESEQGHANGESLDRYPAPVAGGVTVAGFVALATSAPLAPFIVASGLFGLAMTGVARFWVKRQAINDKTTSQLILNLLDES